MRVLLVFTHMEDRHKIYYPFGLASIFSSVEKAGHQVEACVIHTDQDIQLFLEQLAKFNPQVVGFSSVSSQFPYVEKLCGLSKEFNPAAITVCGGVHPTINPGSLRKAPDLDVIFRGESEKAFVDFLDRLQNGRPWNDLDNIGFRQNANIQLNAVSPPPHKLDHLPLPEKQRLGYFDNIERGQPAGFLFSRGCPFNCYYCSNHAIAKAYGWKINRPRFRSPDQCIQDIRDCLDQKPDLTELMFWDDIFGLDKQWREDFLDKYRTQIGLPFTCMLHPLQVTSQLANELKKASCLRVRMGLESGSEILRRKVLNRPISDKRLVSAFQLIQEAGIKTFAYNMIGLPGETEETLQQTVEMNRRISPDQSVVQIFHPYRGAVLGDRCFTEGLVDLTAYAQTSDERTISCLNFSPEFKDRLSIMRYQWERLIYDYTSQEPKISKLVLRSEDMRPAGGVAYRVELDSLKHYADRDDSPFHSLYFVFEEDRRLGPPHSSTAKVANGGYGAFLHKESGLMFSASDNSDPRENQRRYSLEYVSLLA